MSEGGMVALSPCYGCGNVFQYNPELVPSTRDGNGIKRPICGDCMATVNAERVAKGMEPVRIMPGAYEPMVIE